MKYFCTKANRMPLKEWTKLWIYGIAACIVILSSPAGSARPRFDTSTDMGLVLVPADAEIDSVIFRLRATDQDADFPLLFDITATVTPIVRIENLPCTLYNKVCQANVILTKRLVPGRLHDFAVRVKDSKGDSNSMQATISVTNATTQRDKIFPHIPAIIMVPEDSKPGKELDYILVRSNQWSGKPVYIELWQPKELFTIRQRQTPAETRGVITLMGELDFETQSMYTLKMYATDPYTEPKKDTRNIAGLHLVVIVQDVQDVPPIFTLAPPLTKIDNTVQPGDIILRVHAEDGDKGVPREVTYGLVSEGNPFTPFFNISETTGEITLARPLEELTLITHVGAPVVLSIVAEEIRRSTNEPPAQATVVEVGLLLGEPGNSPPFFENDNYVAWMDENSEPGSAVSFTEHYSTRVRDEDIGKAGVFALKLYNNNGTFEINPAVAERVANFIITIRDNSLIDYEIYKSLRFEINAQEVGPATNLSATVPCTIFIRDVNDNAPEFDLPKYEVTLSENVPAGTRVIQVHATDKDTGSFGRIQYTRITGTGNEAFEIDPNTGIITVPMGNMALDREITASLRLSVEARDEDGKGLRGIVPLVVNLLDVNDNPPIFEKDSYEFTLNDDLTNFTMPAIIKALDGDAEPPNNEVRYELVHGNYDNKFYLNEITGEIFLRESINKVRRTRQNPYEKFATKIRKDFSKVRKILENMIPSSEAEPEVSSSSVNSTLIENDETQNFTSESNDNQISSREISIVRKKRENDDILFALTARAYDLGVPHLSGETRIKVMKPPAAGARIVSFVVPGENPDPVKTAETLTAITGGRVTVQEIRPYTINDVSNVPGNKAPTFDGEKKSIVVARVEPNKSGTSLVDIEKIRAALAANGVGVIAGGMPGMETGSESKSNGGYSTSRNANTNITTVHSEEVTVYKAENRLLFWLLIILGLLMLLALIALIICCICPGCPFYMAPRKRRVHSSEILIAKSDERPRRHFHRKHTRLLEGSWPERKHAWSADPMRRNWQFNRRNQKAAGLASLPGDVRVIEREREILEKPLTLNLENDPITMYSMGSQARRPEEERIYIEDVEGMRARGYVTDSFRQQDQYRSEIPQHFRADQDDNRPREQTRYVREQHFYRDGNAEILRLVTREQTEEETAADQSSKRPHTLVMEQAPLEAYRNDGKEILLQRFMEDQKNRRGIGAQDFHDSFQDIERRSMESHQRQKEMVDSRAAAQRTIVLLPERLVEDHRRHIEELGPEVQRLIIDHGACDAATKIVEKNVRGFVEDPATTIVPQAAKTSMEKPNERTTEQNHEAQHRSFRDFELARQNALLTRLLLERDGRDLGTGALVDSASYLETQSLPGQVAIATQTDRTAATQTELPSRSRSDNEESEEDAKIRKKLKSKKRYGETEPRRIRTLWMKAPIEEEELQYDTEKKTIFLRKKTRDARDPRRITLEPEVLREISDSLDENADPTVNVRKNVKKEASNDKEVSPSDSDDKKLRRSSSIEIASRDSGKRIMEKKESTSTADDDDSQRKDHRGKHDDIPSFRILEKEITSLSKKLSKLAGRKMLRYGNGSETDSHENIRAKEPSDGKRTMKKIDIAETKSVSKAADVKTKRSKSTPRKIIPEAPLIGEQTKTHVGKIDDKKGQKVAMGSRKEPIVSTGSSEFEEITERMKKSVPTITHTKKQSRMIAKQPSVKSKKHSATDHKDVSSLVTRSHDSGEGRDTSDTASKGSIKPWKSEREAMNVKRYNTGMVDGQSGLASGSASSDSSRDKKNRKTERRVIDETSALVVGEGKTQLERISVDASSENSRDKKRARRERPTLLKKRAVDHSDEKISEETSEAPNTDELTDETVRKNEISSVDEKHTAEINSGESGLRSTLDVSNLTNSEDETSRSEDKLMLDEKSDVESSERKADSARACGDSSSKDPMISEQQRETIPVVDKISVVDHIEEKTASELNDEDSNEENSNDKTLKIGENITLDTKSSAESKDATKREPMVKQQREEKPVMDEPSAVHYIEKKTASELNDEDSHIESSEDKKRQAGRKITVDKTHIEDHIEEKTAFELNNDDSSTENSKDKKPQIGEKITPDAKSIAESSKDAGKREPITKQQRKERPTLEKASAVDQIEKKTASELNDEDSEDEKTEIREKITLDKASAADHIVEKTASKLNDGDSKDKKDTHTENSKDKELEIREKITLDKTSAADDIEEKTASKLNDEDSKDKKDSLTENSKDEELDIGEKITLDKTSAADGIEEKTASKLNDEDSKDKKDSLTENSKDKELEIGEKITLDKTSAADHIEKRTASELNDEDSNTENSEDKKPQNGEKIAPNTKSNKESEDGAKRGPIIDISHEKEQDKINQGRKSPTLDLSNEEKKAEAGRIELEPISGYENSENLENKQLEKKETMIIDEKKSVDADERDTEHGPPFFPNSDDIQDSTIQKDEKSTLKEDIFVNTGDASSRLPQEILIDPKTAIIPVEESPIDDTETEIKKKSSESSKSVINAVPVPVEVPKSDNAMENLEKATDDATPRQKYENSKPETLAAIKNEILAMPKEQIIDFLDHEIKDSTQSLQGHYHLSSDEAEKIKDTVVESATIANKDEESARVSKKEIISEPRESDGIGQFGEWSKVPDDKIPLEVKMEDSKERANKDQKFKDGGAFSDNFDSFCESEENLNSPESQRPDDTIPYQPLRSQSSTEKIPDDNTTCAKDEIEADDEDSVKMEPAEKPRNIAAEEMLEPQKLMSSIPGPSKIQSPTASPDKFPQTIFDQSRIPSPSELNPLETKTEKPVEASENTTKAEELPEKATTPFVINEEVKVSAKVPPLNIQLLDEQTGTTNDSRGKTPEMISPKSPSQSPVDLILAASPREYGIADFLFLDAKILRAPSSPKEDKIKAASVIMPEKDEMKIDVPPIDLEKLSRAMLDDEDDSDSSEASSRTTLTARPYGTPRRPVTQSANGEAAKDAGKIAEASQKLEETSPDERRKEIVTKDLSQVDIKGDPSGRIVDATIGEKTQPNVEVSSERALKETSKEKSGTSALIRDENLEKDAHQTDRQEETTEKVQLSQIRQKPLLPHPDGLVSLPETSIPVKNIDDTPEETRSSGEIKKLPERFVPAPKSDDLEKRLGDEIRPTKIPSSETKEFPTKTSVKNTRKEIVENRDDDEAKLVPRPKIVKGIAKKKIATKEKLTKTARNVMKPSTKIDFPKKEEKVKALRGEPAKTSNKTTAVGIHPRSQDSKHPEDPRSEGGANLLSRADRVKREKKKTGHPDDDVSEKTSTKSTKAKRISKDVDNSAGKKSTEISAKREEIKASGSKQIQADDRKMETKKIISSDKIEKVMEVRNIGEEKTIKDVHSKKEDAKATESLRPPTERTEITSLPETEKSMDQNPIADDVKLLEDFKKEAEGKISTKIPMLSTEKTEFSEDTKLEAASSENRKIDEESSETLAVDKNTDKSTVLSEPSEKFENAATSEKNPVKMITPLTPLDQQVESENASDQLDAKTEAKSENNENETRDSTEDKCPNIATVRAARKAGKSRKETDTAVIESQSRYMEWYRLKREEMERKRRERKDGDEEETRPKWLRKSTRQRWIKVGPEERRIFDPKMGTETTPSRRRKIKPLVNVESEQLRAIVRQGRKLRKAQGELGDEPQIEIFATEKPSTHSSSVQSNPRCLHHHHHLVQHSEYKYEKMPPASFYLHPQSIINSPASTSLQNFDDLCREQKYSSLPMDSGCTNEIYDSAIIPQQSTNKLRHGELLEKKSVFDIAYSDAAASQLRSDSTTPPS